MSIRLDKTYAYPRWAPDGRHLLLQATVADGQGIYRMDVQSGEVDAASGCGRAEEDLHSLRMSRDGKWIVFARDGKTDLPVVRRDTRSGEERELDRDVVRQQHGGASPDGSRLAWILRTDEKTRVLKVMEFPDGTPKEIRGSR